MEKALINTWIRVSLFSSKQKIALNPVNISTKWLADHGVRKTPVALLKAEIAFQNEVPNKLLGKKNRCGLMDR